MKKLLFFAALLLVSASAGAQVFDFSSNNSRLEVGINLGVAGASTPYGGFGAGFNLEVLGFQLDLLKYGPEHHYATEISDTKWNDSVAFEVNLGYQVPVLPWLRLTPLIGYSQTNQGITDGSKAYVDGDDSVSWYHPYTVTPGTRDHRFNFGGGISIQPLKWFSINFAYTRYAIYGGIALNFFAITGFGSTE
ncbi:MAG: outer membrane beta-barrel protein [Bacteroidales bacterium]|nr:outer membrane beta-barrel protein [Bacteroidales bacterium]